MMGKLKSSYESQRFTEINHWRKEFRYHRIDEDRRSFDFKRLKELFQLTYENKCSKSIKPLMDVFEEVITVRIMYLHINIVNYEDDSGRKDMHASDLELEKFSKDMRYIHNAMSSIYPSFDAVRTLIQQKFNFDTSKLQFNQ